MAHKIEEFSEITVMRARIFRKMSGILKAVYMQYVLDEYAKSLLPGGKNCIGVIEYDDMPEDSAMYFDFCRYGIDLDPVWNWEKYFYFVIKRKESSNENI